ncbi:hypothetical protein BSG1_04740 [Bacillus sp. SG-1]|nr:hypothetical protein BSG1_04740 [Bacillus sp. SG-1]
MILKKELYNECNFSKLFSAILIFITVFSLIKVFIIAFNRKEISLHKLIVLAASSIIIGLLVISTLPFGYQKIMDYLQT